MKKRNNLFIKTFFISLIISSCSPLKIVSSWTEENNNLKNKNVLVITKTIDKTVRIDSENEIQKQLTEAGVKSTSSFKKFPVMTPNKKISNEEIKQLVSIIKSEGFNAVVLTTLKDYKETKYTSQTGGYYAGGQYYDPLYSGFSLYYGNIYSFYGYYNQGVYVPSETTTQTSKKYILETVTYNLDLPDDKELISVVSVEIIDPSDASSISKKYAKQVVQKIIN